MSKKLLLADDSITIQKVIGITFANEDYDLTIVDNGAIALEKARSDRPDLILSDVFMPGKNGYELAAAVKRDPTLQGVPVLLLAGTFEPFDEDKARSAGADDWISKPFESQALIDRVEELLAKNATAPQVPEAAVETPFAGIEEEQTGDLGEEIDLDQESASVEDDLWGAVSFAEEDLGDEQDEFELESFEDDPFEFGETIPSISEAAEEEDFLFGDEPLESAGRPTEEAALPLDEENPFVFEEEPQLKEEAPADQWELAESEEEDFVFEEDPLELMAEPPAGEQSAEGEDEAVTEGTAYAWDESEEDDIFLLEEADILEEEELEVESFNTAVTTSADENPAWAKGAEALAADGDGGGFTGAESAAAAEVEEGENFSLGEEGPEWGIAEPDSEEEEPFAFEEETETFEPVSPHIPAPAAVAPVAGQVQGLSEEDLALVVERVAGTVIERLAGTVIEKIAWEVVPDLAESMIRDELRRLKGEG